MKNHPQKDSVFPLSGLGFTSMAKHASGVRTEIIRKLIHFLIALAPLIASANKTFAMILLAAGTVVYVVMEILRLSGVKVPLISHLTNMASRARDMGRFVWGPVTLGLGALAALLLYTQPAAAIAIYALAFGDGISSLVGKTFGRLRPAFLRGKSVEGSAACFTAVFCASYLASRNVIAALAAALAASVVDALPLAEYDNLVLPVVVGFVAEIVLSRSM